MQQSLSVPTQAGLEAHMLESLTDGAGKITRRYAGSFTLSRIKPGLDRLEVTAAVLRHYADSGYDYKPGMESDLHLFRQGRDTTTDTAVSVKYRPEEKTVEVDVNRIG